MTTLFKHRFLPSLVGQYLSCEFIKDSQLGSFRKLVNTMQGQCEQSDDFFILFQDPEEKYELCLYCF